MHIYVKTEKGTEGGREGGRDREIKMLITENLESIGKAQKN